MRIARESTDRLLSSPDPALARKISAISATNAAMVACLENDHATLAAGPG
jgi:hypothetical protein